MKIDPRGTRAQRRDAFEDICVSRARLELESIVTFAVVLGVGWRDGLAMFAEALALETNSYSLSMSAEEDAVAIERAGRVSGGAAE